MYLLNYVITDIAIIVCYVTTIQSQAAMDTNLSLLCTADHPCTNNTHIVKTDKKDVYQSGRSNPNSHIKKEKYMLVPPFLIGAAVVLVLYVIFHCIYMHCYTEKRVQKIARRAQKAPTIIIHDDMNSMGTSHAFTPMVKMNGGYGTNTDVVTTQPFLVCQPMDDDDDDYTDNIAQNQSQNNRRNSGIRKSLQSLRVPNLFQSKNKRGSVVSTKSSTDSQAELQPNMERTRASICFVPVGKTLNDDSNSNTEWTPLQGFVYSSFVLSRNPSYRHACLSNTSINSGDSNMQDTAAGNSFIFLPRKASFCPSVSQSSQTSNPDELGDILLTAEKPNGSLRKNSRVSFNLNISQHGDLQEEDEIDIDKTEQKETVTS